MTPAIPIAIGVLAAAGVATWAITRAKPAQTLRPLVAKTVQPQAPGSGLDGLMLTAAKVKYAPRPKRVDKETPLEAFVAQHRPIVLEYLGCKTFEWGFCVQDAMEEATAAGGAAAVSSLIEWVSTFTGLNALTNALCFRFRFELHRFKDLDGAYWWAVVKPYPIGDYPAPRQAKHSHERSPAYVRAWVAPGQFWDEGEDSLIAYFPDDDAQTVLIQTANLRTLLREDKIDATTIADAGCGTSRWSITTRAKAMNRFR